ncbi:MAG: hypothetical protein KY468_10790 [Armatimonadetes bacterium]|nr:hypothetical protein [Armatimonadota bacterium]
MKSGPGLLIAEPSVVKADPKLAAFGAGCARWLHLFVGGQGSMGQTPLWTSADRVRQELGRKDLRLTPEEAKKLDHMLGISHVALGTVTGSEKQATLTYRVHSLPGLQPVGTPILLSGSAEQIVLALPSAAREMAKRLEVSSASVPDRVDLRPDELGALGGVPRVPRQELTPAMRQQLTLLSQRSPLAGLLLAHGSPNTDPSSLIPLLKTLLEQAPENTLVLGTIGYKVGIPSAFPDLRAQLDRSRQKHPNNYLLSLCEVWRQRMDENPEKEHQAAERGVQSAYHNPEAWLTLGWTINEEADQVRKKRYFPKLNPVEVEFLERVYPQWLKAVYRSVTLDPLYGKGWLRVSTAACFAGAEELAERAFWKAVRLEKEERDAIWSWGLQMYQPKWLDDPVKLEAVARQAAEEFNYDERTRYIISALKESGNDALAEELSRKTGSISR